MAKRNTGRNTRRNMRRNTRRNMRRNTRRNMRRNSKKSTKKRKNRRNITKRTKRTKRIKGGSFSQLSNSMKANRKETKLLIKAVEMNDLDSVQKLLSQTPKPDIDRGHGERKETPLGIAASNGNVEVMEALIKEGAEVNKSNSLGETPLMIAVARSASKGTWENVWLLLENNASTSPTTKEGDKAVDFAAEFNPGSDIVFGLLLKYYYIPPEMAQYGANRTMFRDLQAGYSRKKNKTLQRDQPAFLEPQNVYEEILGRNPFFPPASTKYTVFDHLLNAGNVVSIIAKSTHHLRNGVALFRAEPQDLPGAIEKFQEAEKEINKISNLKTFNHPPTPSATEIHEGALPGKWSEDTVVTSMLKELSNAGIVLPKSLTAKEK